MLFKSNPPYVTNSADIHIKVILTQTKAECKKSGQKDKMFQQFDFLSTTGML